MLLRRFAPAFAALLAACTAPAADESAPSEAAIIGGSDALDAKYDAIGWLRIEGPVLNGAECTATLIAPRLVLTAKHCAVALGASLLEQGTVTFSVGPDRRAPRRRIPATKVVFSPIMSKGYALQGSDVAVYTLAESVDDIEPLAVASRPPADEDLGTSFLAVGYGVQGADVPRDLRQMGAVTLGALHGPPAKLAFGSVEAFTTAMDPLIAGPLTPALKDSYARWYETPLLDDYEVWTKVGTGDAQPCSGDSGGPLLREVGGKLVVTGVASATMARDDEGVCSHGLVYATFGAHTRKLVADALGETCTTDASGKLTCGAPAAEALACARDFGAGPVAACLGAECCAEAMACLGDAECAALNACMNGCIVSVSSGGVPVFDPSCARTCTAARPAAYARMAGLRQCSLSRCGPAR